MLDIGLPDMDGLDLCRQLRAAGDWTPVLFVTARDEDIDRILGLELGGDDYLVKPFNPRELVARVRAVLRRSAGPGSAPAPVFRAGRVRIDPGQRRVWVERRSPATIPAATSGGDGPDGIVRTAIADSTPREIELTATEFDLLLFLVRHPRRVFERSSLLSSVWGYPAAAGARTVDVHVAALARETGRRQPDQDRPRRRVLGGCPVTDPRATAGAQAAHHARGPGHPAGGRGRGAGRGDRQRGGGARGPPNADRRHHPGARPIGPT